jgi:hypothetical protein
MELNAHPLFEINTPEYDAVHKDLIGKYNVADYMRAFWGVKHHPIIKTLWREPNVFNEFVSNTNFRYRIKLTVDENKKPKTFVKLYLYSTGCGGSAFSTFVTSTAQYWNSPQDCVDFFIAMGNVVSTWKKSTDCLNFLNLYVNEYSSRKI